MKAIAIVNFPFYVDLNKEDAYFVMRDGKYCQRVCLKPLPETKDVGYPIDDYAVGFGDGWDACLKEITK